MPYRLEAGETLTDSVRRIGCEQITQAIDMARSQDLDAAVHDLRKRCKKVRGLLRLVRRGLDEYREANARARDAAKLLSDARDRAVAVRTHDALVARYDAGVDADAFAAIGARLAARKADGDRRGEVLARLESAVSALAELREDLETFHVEGNDNVLVRGFVRTYGRARDALHAALEAPTDEALHELRKRVKYHRYHARLLAGVWPGVFAALHGEAKRLTDVLGEDHDLAELRRLVVGEPEAFGGGELVRVYTALLDDRRQALQAEALAIARGLCDDKPVRVAERTSALLELWR